MDGVGAGPTTDGTGDGAAGIVDGMVDGMPVGAAGMAVGDGPITIIRPIMQAGIIRNLDIGDRVIRIQTVVLTVRVV